MNYFLNGSTQSDKVNGVFAVSFCNTANDNLAAVTKMKECAEVFGLANHNTAISFSNVVNAESGKTNNEGNFVDYAFMATLVEDDTEVKLENVVGVILKNVPVDQAGITTFTQLRQQLNTYIVDRPSNTHYHINTMTAIIHN